tara:strand:+ start:1998 stop:2318 length:321 start_codon:yes stop_codon:yes gene_type:complete
MSSTNNIGLVTWFNKSGYGFIQIVSGSQKGASVFVHHSALKTETKEVHKSLVAGEYVCFDIEDDGNPENPKRYKASKVCGIMEGPLMCETRYLQQQQRNVLNKCLG